MNRALGGAALLASFATWGCGSSQERHTAEHQPLSAKQHEAEASQHERAAQAAARSYTPPEETSTELRCFDQSLAPDPTSGAEPMRIIKPCWASERGAGADKLEEAQSQRRAAADHRARARELVDAEREACRGLGEDEISHSPFFHRADIAKVTETRSDGQLVGAKTYFRKVPGLTERWMSRAVRCHQARAAVMGYNPRVMSYCPLMLEGIAASVEEDGEFIVVGLRASSEEMAAAAVGRLHDLVDPPR